MHEGIWSHLAIVCMICVLSSTDETVVDLTNICESKETGHIVSHPFDCRAYFICGNVPSIQYCDEGLHYDAMRRVCNWPEQANCKLATSNADGSESNAEPAPAPLITHPIFIAIDVDTGRPTDPMAKYDPEHIECRHFGAYFLPHPRSCRRYYICAYGHLHRHKCGEGTAWNYIRQECELDASSECYSRNIMSTDIDAGNTYISDENAEQLSNLMTSSEAPATTTMPSTVCFVIDTTIVTGQPTGTTFNPTGTTFNPTGTGFNPTGTTFNPTGTYRPTPSSAKAPPTPSTGRFDGLLPGLKCPKNGDDAYLPNADDCRKYFICIAGRPVATTCPLGLYWDQDSEFCDLPKNVKCYGKLSVS